MSLWLIRAGRHGEFEERFLEDGRVYLTWHELDEDLSQLKSMQELRDVMSATYPSFSKGKLSNHTGQVWSFTHRMEQGGWVVVPSKFSPTIHVGEITGQYEYEEAGPAPFHHCRKVRWMVRDVPRTIFDQDILYSFGAFMTICRIERNDAERRVRAMAASGWRRSSSSDLITEPMDAGGDTEPEAIADLEQVGRDEIARLILAKFKGHRMEELVEAILRAQGYTTYRSPEGADKGIELLAAPGPMGFGQPRVCVQVKSGEAPVDRPTLDQLIGAMQNVQAEQGLLVAWGGFKSTVSRERATQFFRVRLWDQDDLIRALQDHYESLSGDLRAELPLKRVWTVAHSDGDDE